MKAIAGSIVVLAGAGLFGAIYCSDGHREFPGSPAVLVPLVPMLAGLAVTFHAVA